MKKILCSAVALMFFMASVSACSMKQATEITDLTLKTTDLSNQYIVMNSEFEKYFSLLTPEEQEAVTRADMVIKAAINEVKDFSIQKDYSKLTVARLTRTVNAVVFEYNNLKKIVESKWSSFSISDQAKLANFDAEAQELYKELVAFAKDPSNTKSIEIASKVAAMGILLAKTAEVIVPIVAAQFNK